MVFQRNARSLWGEQNTEHLFCATSQKRSPKSPTSPTSGDTAKCHPGISPLLRQIKQRWGSGAQLTAAIQSSTTSFSPCTRQFRPRFQQSEPAVPQSTQQFLQPGLGRSAAPTGQGGSRGSTAQHRAARLQCSPGCEILLLLLPGKFCFSDFSLQINHFQMPE